VRSVVEHVAGTDGSAPIAIIGPASFVEVDVGRLEQVITNLVTNAIKYGEKKPIEIEVAREPVCVVVRVRDHGIGIAPEKQQRIFERFERAVSVRPLWRLRPRPLDRAPDRRSLGRASEASSASRAADRCFRSPSRTRRDDHALRQF